MVSCDTAVEAVSRRDARPELGEPGVGAVTAGAGWRPKVTHTGRTASADSPLRSEFEGLLGENVCPACSYLAERERSFFSWFANENHTAANVQAELRASMGMCAAHSRRLMKEPGPGPIVTMVAREALAGALSRMRDGTPSGPCPACYAKARSLEDTRHLVLDALERERDASRYREHPGLCLDHLLALEGTDQATAIKVVTEHLLERLITSAGASALEMLAGVDDDASRRAFWRERLVEPEVMTSTIAQLCGRLEITACPACLAGGLAEARYLDWFLKRSQAGDPSLRTDPGELCSAHLRDAALQDPAGARCAIERKRTVTTGALARLLDQLARLPQPNGRRRRNEGQVTQQIRATVRAVHECPVCRARDTAELRQLQLLDAALALPSVRSRYESSHGLCVHHALRLSDGPSAPIVRRVVSGRLGVLAWEVAEIRRKYVWASRYELAGPEQDAWLRAFAQIDGRVLSGGPPPPIRPTGRQSDDWYG